MATPIPLRNLWDRFPSQTQQSVINALIKMLDQASPVTEKEQRDDANI